MKRDWFWHLTLNTADTRKSYRREVDDASLESMRQMGLINPEADLFPGYRVKTSVDAGCAVFTVYNAQIPLVHCILAINASDEPYWKLLEDVYLQISDKMPIDWALSEKPASTPWLAVVLLSGIAYFPEAAGWLGDFERCFAWLLIEDVRVSRSGGRTWKRV
jgi:hypothetical protein